MSAAWIKSERWGGLKRITLNRPDRRNALTRQMLVRLSLEVGSLDEGVRVVLLDAEGPAFCSGMDLTEMQQRAEAADAVSEWRADALAYRDAVVGLLTAPVPTLAVVAGPAVAGGLGLVLACDMVLAAEAATFALPEPKRGITAAVVAPLLVHRVGHGAASYVLLSGESITADTARQLGLCHEVVPPGDLVTREQALVRSILSGAAAALATTKRELQKPVLPKLIARIDAGMQVSADLRARPEAREGLAAFRERRRPAWDPDSG